MNMHTTTETTPLAPCPFCGAPAHGYAIEPHSHSPSLMRLIPELPDHHGSYVIEGQCACGSGLIGADEAEVVARWNRRALQPMAPTDAELDELRQANSGRLNFVTLSEFRTIARAVLAKWGTLRAEKIVIPTDTMEQEFQKHYRRGYEAVKKAATPQPTQAQAGALESAEFGRFLSDVLTAAGLVTHGKQCKALGERLADMCAKLRLHSIKGGQHGIE